METRRRFLRNAALLAGAAGSSGTLLDSIKRAAGIAPEVGSTFWDAEHVVILMQENRSFDHAFGTLRGVRGFDDPRAITLPNGNPVWAQTNGAGATYVPFRLNLNDTQATWMGALPHSWTDQVDARNGGLHDRWLDAKRSGDAAYAHIPLTLGYHTREDLPFYYELADAFTICDQHFCSSLTATTPNRLHLWTGTIRAEQRPDSPAHVLNSDADYEHEVSWSTFPERLEDLGVTWKVYQNEVGVGVGLSEEEDAWLGNFGDNPLEYFTQFRVRYIDSHRKALQAQAKALAEERTALRGHGEADDLDDRLTQVVAELQQIQAQMGQWSRESFDRLPPRERSLHQRAFATNVGGPAYRQLVELEYRDGEVSRRVNVPRGDLLYQFRRDVAEGSLPTVSWLVAPERFSDHPSSPWYGAWYIAEALDILTRNPEVWKKTIFIVTYDENDGYFDHVPPFVAPHPRRPQTGLVSDGIDAGLEYVDREAELRYKQAHEARDSPIGLGFRVPLIVASPWSRGGCVCSQVFDHTSPLRLLERLLSRRLGRVVREPNISDWRRTVCGDLTAAFQAEANEGRAALSFPLRDAFVAHIHGAQFKAPPAGYEPLTDAELQHVRHSPRNSPRLPRQESGLRRSCPLPYELSVEGSLTADGTSFALALSAGNRAFADEAAGSPFIAVARLAPDHVQTRNYAVRAGDRIRDAWPLADSENGAYHLEIYGPNGFYRAFYGGAGDPALDERIEYERSPAASDRFSGNIELHLTNRDDRGGLNVEVADLAYDLGVQRIHLGPGASQVCTIEAQQSHSWYDLAVRVEGEALYQRRYAGRVETGRWSFSDPAIGRATQG